MRKRCKYLLYKNINFYKQLKYLIRLSFVYSEQIPNTLAMLDLFMGINIGNNTGNNIGINIGKTGWNFNPNELKNISYATINDPYFLIDLFDLKFSDNKIVEYFEKLIDKIRQRDLYKKLYIEHLEKNK